MVLKHAVKAMSTSTPERRWNAAQMYFYTELRSSLGNKVAELWLSGTSAGCADPCQVPSVSNTPTVQRPTDRHKNNRLYSNIQGSLCHPQTSSLISAADTPGCLSPFSSSESLPSKIECFSSVPTPHKRHSVLLCNEGYVRGHGYQVIWVKLQWD